MFNPFRKNAKPEKSDLAIDFINEIKYLKSLESNKRKQNFKNWILDNKNYLAQIYSENKIYNIRSSHSNISYEEAKEILVELQLDSIMKIIVIGDKMYLELK